jgi:pyruvate formate lyase activating enzyme
VIEARYYNQLPDGRVQCQLCFRRCLLGEGETGACGMRSNRGGRLWADAYAETVGNAYDPIEKKPLYHFHPGAVIFSTGPNGCNLDCPWCQNWQISKQRAPTTTLSPEALVRLAGARGSIGISYTYTEPLLWFEYFMDVAPLVRGRGLKNVLVTNGTVEAEPLSEMLPYVDALNVDLKAIRSPVYRKVCRGDLASVQRTIERSLSTSHLEITNLIIPTVNDQEDDLRDLARWVASLSADIPLHFSRYFPHYRSALAPTPLATLTRAADIAKEYLRFVYLGNVQDPEHSTTYCPGCGKEVIRRSGMATVACELEGHRCRYCKRELPIIVD